MTPLSWSNLDNGLKLAEQKLMMNRSRILVSRGRVDREFFVRKTSRELQGDCHILIYDKPKSFALTTFFFSRTGNSSFETSHHQEMGQRAP